MQQYPLPQTKLYTLPVRHEFVSRPRLIERLNAGISPKTTLFCAPAGAGLLTRACMPGDNITRLVSLPVIRKIHFAVIVDSTYRLRSIVFGVEGMDDV